MQHLSIPLKNLKALETVARHLSFTKAAEELHVTPSAISQQIKQLEERLNVVLFIRNTRSLELTQQAQQALPHLIKGFDELYAGINQLTATSTDNNLLTISVGASYGARWLLPRLASFKVSHPDIDIRIDATDELADLTRDGVDLAIRHGIGSYPGLQVELLMRDVAFPVCAPSLFSPCSLSEPVQLKNFPLLHVDWRLSKAYAPTWEKWHHYHGLDYTGMQHGARFNMDDMSLNAAIAGMGVALITRAFIINDLVAGRLVKPFGQQYDMPTSFHHFLVYPDTKQLPDRVSAFIEWIKQQALVDIETYEKLVMS